MTELNDRRPARGEVFNVTLLCLVGLAINLGSFAISETLRLPIHFDAAGTIFSAALGGSLPGILTGFLSNMILGLRNSTQMYFSLVSIIAAMLTVRFARKGYFTRFVKALETIPVLTIVTGLLSAGLTWFLNDSNIGGLYTDFAMRMHRNAGVGRFTAQLTWELLHSLLDKSVAVLLVYLALRFLPQALLDGFHTTGRWQAPLSDEMKATINRQKGRGMSLRARVVLLLLAGLMFITSTACIISFRLFKDSMVDEYTHMARLLTSMVAGLLEDEPVEDYIAYGRDAEGYDEFEQTLYKLKESYPDVEYLYVYQIKEDGCHVVFDLDTEDVEGGEPGSVQEFGETFEPYIPALLRGEPIDPIVSDDAFGWLLTAYHPVHGGKHTTLCYVGADFSMNMLSLIGVNFITRLASLMLSVFIVVLALALDVAEHNVLLPVKSMAYCAGAFAYDSEEARGANVQQLRGLDIRTGDEIENLYRAFLKTTEDSMNYVDNLIHARLQVAEMKEQVSVMDEIAYKDALTGLRNKASYDEFTARLDAQIAGGKAEFGIAMIDLNYLKRVNDTYGHEHGNDYLKACSRMVCDVFDHSPVFRVGGDEFVVILENGDLAERESLVAALKGDMKNRAADASLQPWEKVSAAVGVAVYAPGADKSADDVFKRADAAMYADKQAMKAVRRD